MSLARNLEHSDEGDPDYIERRLEPPSRTPEDLQRRGCTVLVERLGVKTEEREVFEFFSRAGIGRVKEVRLVKDPITNANKGAAYVEFTTPDAVLKSIALTGQSINGVAIQVQAFQPEQSRGAPSSWLEEKRLLMDMLEKSQRIAQTTQLSFQNDKTEIEDQQRRIEESLKGQILQLKKENTMLRSEMDRLRKCSGCTGDLTLRSKLLQEIERLEATANTKESKLHFQITELTQKLSGEQQITTEARRKHEDETEFLKSQIEKLRRENNVMGDNYKREENILRMKLDNVQGALSTTSAELERLKLVAEEREKQILRLKSSTEDVWSGEKHSLLEENGKFVKLLEDKERMLEAQLRAIQNDKDEALKIFKERQDQLLTENKLLQDKVQSAVRFASEKEYSLQREVDRLRKTNFSLMETTQTREEVQQADNKGLRSKLEKLQKAYKEREKTYNEEVQGLRDEIVTLHKQIFEIESQSTSRAAPDVTEKLRNEIGILESQLADKADQLENMKEMYLSAKTNERAQITKAIQASQRTIEEFKKQQTAIQVAYDQLQEAMSAAGPGDLESHRKLLAEMKEMIEENARMNIRLKETEKLEKENEAKRKELERLKHELEFASNNWRKCESAMKEMESIIDEKVREDASFSQTDLLHRTTLENQRLSAENLNLTDIRNKLEEFYLIEVKNLRSEIQAKTREIDELKNQNARLKAFRTKKGQEELSGWQVRQDALEKTIRALETEIGVLKANVETQGQMAAATRNLEGEELKLLRKEVLDKESWVTEMKQSWDEEKAELRGEVKRLRQTLREIEVSREKANKSLQDELAALVKQRDSLKKVEDDRLRRMDGEREALANTSSKGFSKSKASPQAVVAAREEVEALKAQFANEKLKWSAEMEETKLMASSELQSARQVEIILNRHVKSQQDQLMTMTKTLEEVRTLHAQEIKTLRQELGTLRKSAGAHTQLLQTERKTLATEIERVSNLAASRKDSLLVNNILEKVMKLQSDLAIVKGAYEKSIRLDPSNIDDVQKVETDLAELREQLERGDKIRREERAEINEAIATIRDSISAVQSQALTERDMLVKETEVLSKRLKTLQNDADCVRRQRDEALEGMTKMKNLGKLERSELVQLIDSLKTQERTRIAQLQEEYMRLIQQSTRPQAVKKKK
mmetsp:Transcript_9854/g.19515  ORF Transcript_9854/g.19515 Transcript_9854/m.19515 type:complete len:1161 (-) Transcript_9854:77-3559(-)